MSASFLVAMDGRSADERLPALSATYAALAAGLPPLMRRLLVNNADPATINLHDVLEAIEVIGTRGEHASRHCRGVHDAPGLLSSAACRSLRDAVDAASFDTLDSVDGQLEFQLSLETAKLRSLVGDAEWDKLLSVAASSHAKLVAPDVRQQASKLPGFEALGFASPCSDFSPRPYDIFVRKYSASTRPWLKFHYDRATLTMNVALSDDGAHTGGDLLAIANGQIRRYTRAEGTAIVHSSSLMHAVTRMRAGSRYSLIIFFGNICPSASHRMILCSSATMSVLYADDVYEGGYHCDMCGQHSEEAIEDTNEDPRWFHCSEWCDYDLCGDCHADLHLAGV